MVKVCIERQLLPVADMLVDIFTMRMAEIGIREEATTNSANDSATGSANANSKILRNYDLFLCSAEFAEKNGGTSIERAPNLVRPDRTNRMLRYSLGATTAGALGDTRRDSAPPEALRRAESVPCS